METGAKKRKEDMIQKSRVNWTSSGYENSRFFHAMINSNISSNRIHGMMIQGQWVTDPRKVKDFVADFFKAKFDHQPRETPDFSIPGLRKLTTRQADELILPFSKHEVKLAVWECDGNKAPGPDGFNFSFIKRYWGLLEQDFFELMIHFYNHCSISWGVMSAFIALLPKKSDPQSPNDSRPVSLIGVINKAISKVLMNRLKGVINDLIADEQSAFVAKRSILEGPLILNKVISWLKKSKGQGMFLKLDVAKAFDSVYWEFLDKVLMQMNFPPRWRCGFKRFWDQVGHRFLSMAVPLLSLSVKKGLRQGDPLSPFLLIIAMETWSCIIKKATTTGLFEGLKLPNNGPTLSHFLFADDVVILSKGNEMSV